MNIAEHIRDLENTRAAKVSRRKSIDELTIKESRTYTEAEAEEHDALTAEIEQIDADWKRYNVSLAEQAKTAQPIEPKAGQAEFTKQVYGAPTIITRQEKPEAFEGQNFTRMCIAKALARETGVSPIAIAEKRWSKSNPNLVEVIKADVAGHGSGSGEAGAELITSDRYMQDFIEFLYGMTVYDRLPLRTVPANITIGEQDGAATGYWVGESKAIPVSVADFNSVSLTPLKVAALSVCSKEWLRDASPSAEMLVRDSLVQAAVQRIDTTFLSTTAASAGVSPAGILNNIAGTTSAGTDGDAVANDFKELMYRFTTAKNAGGQYIVMNPALATGLALLRNALDQYEFPNITEEGGSIFGKPVVTGDNVNANHLIMLKPSDIYRIEAGSLDVSVSESATVEMADNPAADTDTPTAPTGKTVSMFQTESVAFKVVLPLNFQRRRESAVAWISDADYGGAIST